MTDAGCNDSARHRRSAANVLRATVLMLLFATDAVAGLVSSAPGFSKTFSPATIGPGSVSMLIFTIDNSKSSQPVGALAFSDTLPDGMVLAAPAVVSNNCGGTLTAPNGGDTITLVDGTLARNATCQIIVNVTAGAGGDGPYVNISGDLTSTAGNSGTATAELNVDEGGRPGFRKSFAPSNVSMGGRSTLTFTIDNTTTCGECAADLGSLSFTDNLPLGMVVANPANASTDCGNPSIPATLTAVPGTSLISLSASGLLPSFPVLGGEEICTVTVDVIGGAVGSLGNVSGELLVGLLQGVVSSGKAAAVLNVTGFDTLLTFAKEFTDDPVPPGGTVTLEFTVTNRDRDDAATGITFDDDLEATLSGLTPNLPPTPDPPCGAGSSLAFSAGVLTLTGGTLPPEGSCTFSVELDVPGGATPGTYPNTAGPVSGDVGGSPETGNSAGDLLFVDSFPNLTKEFIGDPVGAGGTVTLQFTISNPDATSAMSGIAFTDVFTAILPTSSSGAPAPGFCGPGSMATFNPPMLIIMGGSLAANGMPGDSCSFSITLDVAAGAAAGTYPNTTSGVSGVLDGVAGTPTVVGPAASDDLVVVGAPRLSKAFTDDPVPPGGTVTLEFTLTHGAEAPAAATGITFTDDLAALVPAIAGLTATLPPNPDPPCGVGSSLTGSAGDTFLTFAGGTLAPGETCTFSVSLSVPSGAPSGFHSNETSDVSATVGGVAVSGGAAVDDLLVSGLLFSKAFTDDPVIAGGAATLQFTLDNTTGSENATGINFTDNLAAALPGLAAILPPVPNPPCGGGSSLSGAAGNTFLTFAGGSVPAGTSCTFSVVVTVPPGTPDNLYANVTSALGATIGSNPPTTLPPAKDNLIVSSGLLDLTKEFTNDPVEPGDTVSLQFTLTNLSATATITDIAFEDDLDAALSGLTATGPTSNTCGGMAGGFPTGLFSYSGGTLMPGASCTITLDVAVPAAPLSGGIFANTTSQVTGKVGALDVFGDAASDNLLIQLLAFSKSFDGPTAATGTALLSFTITNLDSANAVTGLAFSDNLGAVISGLAASGLPAMPCGAGSALAGTSFLTLSGGSLPAGGSCTFAVSVAVPGTASTGTFLNTTSALFQSGVAVAAPATALLTIEPPPTFAKAFAPDTIDAGAVSTLTFTVDNSASAVAASALTFTDNLPAGVVVATPPNASNFCGGTLTAVAGTGVITHTGGSVAAGAGCEISVDVTGGVAGMQVNTTGDLTSSSGNSGTASDTLTVNVVDPNSDLDGDGVNAGTEDACPNGGDGNDDGTLDSAQPQVTSLPLPSGKCVTVVTSGACAQNQNVATFSEGDVGADPIADYPFGLVGFTLPCQTADVRLIFHGEDDPAGLGYRKYGPMAPLFGPPVFYSFPAVFGTTLIAGQPAVTVMFSLTNGLLGDGTSAADAVIVDPGGPAMAVTIPAAAPAISPLGLWCLIGILFAVGSGALLRRRRQSGSAVLL